MASQSPLNRVNSFRLLIAMSQGGKGGKSQSPLNRVNSFRLDIWTSKDEPDKVSIPSESGQQFPHRRRPNAHLCLRGVSIPSESGQQFPHRYKEACEYPSILSQSPLNRVNSFRDVDDILLALADKCLNPL